MTRVHWARWVGLLVILLGNPWPLFGQAPSQEKPLTPPQQLIVRQDVLHMDAMLQLRMTELNDWNNPAAQARFQKWFGTDPKVDQVARKATIYILLSTIDQEFKQGRMYFRFNPKAPANVLAYVYPSGPFGKIVLARAYFTIAAMPSMGPRGWKESRPGTLIHEMGHFHGWEHPDNDYSWNGAINRAKNAPQGALKNAVNLRFWAEGAP